MCTQCLRGDHHLCGGLVGPITTHPDSLPLCSCSLRGHAATIARTPKETDHA